MPRVTPTAISLADRFEHGVFSVQEAAVLANCSPSQIYLDVAAGRLELRKFGRRSGITGPSLRAFLDGGQVSAAA
jgi:hypothetical protein